MPFCRPPDRRLHHTHTHTHNRRRLSRAERMGRRVSRRQPREKKRERITPRRRRMRKEEQSFGRHCKNQPTPPPLKSGRQNRAPRAERASSATAAEAAVSATASEGAHTCARRRRKLSARKSASFGAGAVTTRAPQHSFAHSQSATRRWAPNGGTACTVV